MTALDFVDEELAALEARGRRRGVRVVEARRGVEVMVDGRWVISFCSNDYLGLSMAPEVIAAARAAVEREGVGAGASRLITGTSEDIVALERELAAFHGAPAALVFGSAYAANTGVIPAVVGRGDVVFSDALDHASIVDGCRLSRAEVRVWPHGDVEALARMLGDGAWRRRLIVSESVFSMDGDRAPLEALARLARAHDAMLMIDDAHAVGIAGRDGRGYGVAAGADLVVGAMGKAFGTAGGYLLGSEALVQLVWNRARSLVFSTAPAVPVVAASRAALALLAGEEGAARRRLAVVVRRVRRALFEAGIAVDADGESPIIPVIAGEDRRAVAWSEALLARGVLVQAIRPPTVPEGTARLRVTLSALHTDEQVESLLVGLRARG